MPPGPKILLVEDDAAVRDALAALLRHCGYEFREAVDGLQAAEIFALEPADIVITDVRMPGIDGLELLARVKRAAPETCVIILTGYGGEDIAIQAMRRGASNYFKKPLEVAQFVYALGVVADMVRSRRERRFDHRLLEREARTLRLSTDLDEICPAVNELTATTAALGFDVESIRVALLEALTNAVEHGSLDISYGQKRAALAAGGLRELYRSRAAQAPWRERTVLVEYEATRSRAWCRVTDQGAGFDWRALPDCAAPENLTAGSGRGIVVIRLSVDEVSFNEQGNQVTLVKLPRPAAGAAKPAPAR